MAAITSPRNLKMKRLSLGLLLFCVSARADFETWMAGYFNAELGGKWLGSLEIQNRLSENSRGQDRLLVRPAFGYQFARRHSAWLGYGWTPTFYPSYRDEQRIWQQTLANYAWGNWSLNFRFRLEQRFIAGAGGMVWRWREWIRLGYAVSPDWSLVVWDEFFFALNGNAIAKRGFDQNRFFFGPEFALGENSRLQSGYLNVLVSRSGGVTANHVIWAALTWNLTEG